ncbi:hypothetical protein HHK36_013427 [Tetracentron sinense]|uniref:AP2/ERF domain-containing protein n=1 Tax=Tetracentron sinense TaxID=13715 RepID=A0A834ZA88_TETSI|nr:hypothetical protein HHK36_013427 [Tetracentron sinense]
MPNMLPASIRARNVCVGSREECLRQYRQGVPASEQARSACVGTDKLVLLRTYCKAEKTWTELAGMVSMSNKARKRESRRKRTPGPFKGVRMRKWGRWVSEIRVPRSQTRIWLGSYDVPEKAARAYDAALYCLRGARGRFNFPTGKRPELPNGSSPSHMEIKAIAAKFASPDCVPVPSPVSSSMTIPTASPDVVISSELGNNCEVLESHASHTADSISESDMFLPENFLWDDPILLDPGWIWDL